MRVLVIGGGQVGRSAADALAVRNDVTVLSRSTQPSVDVESETSIRSAFAHFGSFDAVVSCVGHVPFASATELTPAQYTEGFMGKVLPQLTMAKVALEHLTDRGSITLTSGILARYPIAGSAVAAMANGALESFVMAAATDLPRGIRINAVSPTWLAGDERFAAFFPGFVPVAPAVVGQAYVRSVEGVETGKVFILD